MSEDPQPEVRSEPAPNPREPSVLLMSAVIVFAIAYATYYSPHRWSTAGLACMTASALVAAPELLGALLRRATGDLAHRLIRRFNRIVRRASYIIYMLACCLIVLESFTYPGTAISLTIFFAISFTFFEVLARQIRGVSRDIASGGAVDRRVAKRLGPEIRWLAAGGFFFAGTALQLIGTFVGQS